VIGHALLAIYDMDKEAGEGPQEPERDWPVRTTPLGFPNVSKKVMDQLLKEVEEGEPA
jgi:hypothetical protein